MPGEQVFHTLFSWIISSFAYPATDLGRHQFRLGGGFVSLKRVQFDSRGGRQVEQIWSLYRIETPIHSKNSGKGIYERGSQTAWVSINDGV